MKDYVIKTENISRYFKKIKAVDSLSLNIERGKIYGFLGPNGSGKSTTIRMLTGLLTPSEGKVEVLGLNLPRQVDLLRPKIGYMTQKFSLYQDLTVIENLSFMGDIYGLGRKSIKNRIAELIKSYSLDEIKNQQAFTLSGGQKQRLALAASIIHRPEILFLDEPTAAVDPEIRRDFWESLFDLSEQNVTILVSTHYMDEAERCHSLAILDKGQKRVDGQPRDLMDGIGSYVVEVGGLKLRSLKKELMPHSEVRSVSQIGAHLRIIISDKIGTDPVKWLQSKVNEKRNFCKVRPSLEDVFVICTGKERYEES